MTQADAATPVQHKFLMPQLVLFFTIDGDIAAVGTLVDEYKLVAPPLNSGVYARGQTVLNQDIGLLASADYDDGRPALIINSWP